MKKYIELEAAKEAARIAECDADYDGQKYTAGCVEFALDYTPAADVVEVRHGRWIKDEETGDYYCSVCRQGAGWPWYNYCYDCGAKMDGGADDATD